MENEGMTSSINADFAKSLPKEVLSFSMGQTSRSPNISHDRSKKHRKRSLQNSNTSSSTSAGPTVHSVTEGVLNLENETEDSVSLLADSKLELADLPLTIESPPLHQIPFPSLNLVPVHVRDSNLKKNLSARYEFEIFATSVDQANTTVSSSALLESSPALSTVAISTPMKDYAASPSVDSLSGSPFTPDVTNKPCIASEIEKEKVDVSEKTSTSVTKQKTGRSRISQSGPSETNSSSTVVQPRARKSGVVSNLSAALNREKISVSPNSETIPSKPPAVTESRDVPVEPKLLLKSKNVSSAPSLPANSAEPQKKTKGDSSKPNSLEKKLSSEKKNISQRVIFEYPPQDTQQASPPSPWSTLSSNPIPINPKTPQTQPRASSSSAKKKFLSPSLESMGRVSTSALILSSSCKEDSLSLASKRNTCIRSSPIKGSPKNHSLSPSTGALRNGVTQNPQIAGSLSVSSSPGGSHQKRKPIFPDYLPPEEISHGLKSGLFFQATFRVNARNRLEAYVTWEGLFIDVLISGGTALNRAMEGDVVVVEMDHPSLWPQQKGVNKGVNAEKTKTPLYSNDIVSDSDPLAHSDEKSIKTSVDGNEEESASYTSKRANGDSGSLHMGDEGLGGDKRQDTPLLTVDDYSVSERVSGKVLGEKQETESDMKKVILELILKDPSKRPSGRVVTILEFSKRRETLVGFLELNQKKKEDKKSKDSKKPGNKERGKLEGPLLAGADTKKLDESQALISTSSSGEEESDSNQVSWQMDGSVLFVPVDTRFSKMIVHVSGLPDPIKERFKANDSSLTTELVAARVDSWKATSHLPHAILKHSLGQAGEIETETAAIMFQHNIHGLEFPDEALACLPKSPWKIPSSVINERWDLRDRLIFSIDPPTARDLDDALSLETLPNGNVRVGVHIADVSYFVLQGTALDEEARRRSTSVYLNQRVLPMLPALLCEGLCSLNPGVDRLAFSVIWDMDSDGEILSQWIGKTVIRTACKLAYGDAQEMIEGMFLSREEGDDSGVEKAGDEATGDKERMTVGSSNGTRPLLSSGIGWGDVIDSVLGLNKIAQKLRHRRYSSGAVKLDNCKILFSLNADGNPVGIRHYVSKEANSLVEEFMLLANMTVARVISKAFPKNALLRRHPEPNSRKLTEFALWCEKQGLDFDGSSSGAIHQSLLRLEKEKRDDPAVFELLLLHATKPMQLAKYFSTGEWPGEEDKWAHYALATPYYTHFTSPIRRYPDLVVHRTLAAALHAEEKLAEKFNRKNGSVLYPMKGNYSSLSPLEVPVSLLGRTGTVLGLGLELNGVQKVKKKQRGEDRKERDAKRCTPNKSNSDGNKPLEVVPRTESVVDTQKIDINSLKFDSGHRWLSGANKTGMGREMPKEVARETEKASKDHSLFDSYELEEVAKYCNERKLASKSAQEASDKIYLCVLLKQCKGILSDARIMALGPRFMTIYIRKFGLERNIHYEDMEGIQAEWFESTATLLLGLPPDSKSESHANKHKQTKPGGPSKYQNHRGGGIDFVDLDMPESDFDVSSYYADVDNVGETNGEPEGAGIVESVEIAEKGRDTHVEPGVLPMTLKVLYPVPVLVYAVGGGNRPMDVAVKLHVSSYMASSKREEREEREERKGSEGNGEGKGKGERKVKGSDRSKQFGA